MKRLIFLFLVLLLIGFGKVYERTPQRAPRKQSDPAAEAMYRRETMVMTRFYIGEPQEIWGVILTRGRDGEPDGVSWYALDSNGEEHYFLLHPSGVVRWEHPIGTVR